MLTNEKKSLTAINKIPLFNEAIKKLTLGEEMLDSEKVYLLSCAIVFIKYYDSDKRFTSFAELSYYIILKYSLKYNDYLPLFDFTVNFGFYPITQVILDAELLPQPSMSDALLQHQLDLFSKGTYTETLHQFNQSNKLLLDQANEKSYIAPTSFGKSSLILDFIKALGNNDARIGIIVPTKSLLMQTYRMIKEANLGQKIIIHDEMYQGETSFIGVLTQERALRLMNKSNVDFNVLFVDEAHKIFDGDIRSVLITRLISKNRLKNPHLKVIYLSPLVDDTRNLKLNSDQQITEFRIPFSVKEPEIYELKLNGDVFKYNRFVGAHYHLRSGKDMFSHIFETQGEKNFIYNYTPKKVEAFAKELSGRLNNPEASPDIDELIKILKHEVHESFFAIDYLRYGIVYLHGKLPDIIKEYLESKFRDIKAIKFIVANSVILEGINLPIDCLYILNTYRLNGKELTNLIGRVNRLNTIFTNDGSNLDKLLPNVHFINSEKYNRAGSKMTDKIEQLRSRIFKDNLQNPILENFDLDKLLSSDNDTKKQNVERVIKTEELLKTIPVNFKDQLMLYLINSGINEFYEDIGKLLEVLEKRIQDKNSDTAWLTKSVFDKINDIFIESIEFIRDPEFRRLRDIKARNYYEFHITVSQRKSLKENITYMFEFFKTKIEKDEGKFYFGKTYGEEVFDSENENASPVYIDLAKKSDKELINLAIVKLKMEDDFVSYKLNKFIVMLYDFELISKDEYYTYIYGTTDQNKINLTKLGLSIGLISKLEIDGQLGNLEFDASNNLISTSEFESYKASVNDFFRFELNRFLS